MSHDKIEDQDDVSIEDRRRVKLADLHRVEGLLNQAVGRLAEVEKALLVRDEGRMSRAEFYARAITGAVGVANQKQWRDLADIAWDVYCRAMAGEPRKSLEDLEREKSQNFAPVKAPTMTPANFDAPDLRVEPAKA